MEKWKCILANYDARLKKVKIKPKNLKTKVTISSKMYDEQRDREISAKIRFYEVVAIDFRINYFDCMIGAEAFGLYCSEDAEFIKSVVKDIFERRREVYLLEENYDYEPDDENDMLNSLDVSGDFMKHINQYKAFIQNVDAGAYIIVAKEIEIKK